MGRGRSSFALPGVAAALAVVVAAPLVAALEAGGADPPTPATRSMLVAALPSWAVAVAPDGNVTAELPWLRTGDTDPAISPDGRRIAFASARDGDFDLYVADGVTGAVGRLTTGRGDDRRPAWSPDGTRILWQRGPSGEVDLFLMDADGGGKRRLAGGPGDQVEGAWSPDGATVAFASNEGGTFVLLTVPVGGGEAQLLAEGRTSLRAPAWHPDGGRLAYTRANAGGTELEILDVGSGVARRVTSSGAAELRPVWSPDGRSLAVVRAAVGGTSAWIVRANGAGERRLAGTEGVTAVAWGVSDPALAPGPDQRLPDLDTQGPAGVVVVEQGGRFRLGFDSAVDNIGIGSLHIRGWRTPDEATMQADQLVATRLGAKLVVPEIGRLSFEAHPPHRHWHLQDFVRYELVRAGDRELVGRDRKSGFCLIDRYGFASKKVENVRKPRFVGDCATGNPKALEVEEGTSPGYVDRYPAFFHGQDVDLTGVATGDYVLVHTANPELLMRESRYSNNAASALVRLSRPNGPDGAPTVRVLRVCRESALCEASGERQPVRARSG